MLHNEFDQYYEGVWVTREQPQVRRGIKPWSLEFGSLSNHAGGLAAIAMGMNAIADADHAIAIGPNTNVTGAGGVAIGPYASAAFGAVAIRANASGSAAVALCLADAYGESSVAIGPEAFSVSKNAVSIGWGIAAPANEGSCSIGRWNADNSEAIF